MKRKSIYTMYFREKMDGENLYIRVWKQPWSFKPNGKLELVNFLVGFNVIPRYREAI